MTITTIINGILIAVIVNGIIILFSIAKEKLDKMEREESYWDWKYKDR